MPEHMPLARVILALYNDRELRNVIRQLNPMVHWFPISIVGIGILALVVSSLLGATAFAIFSQIGVCIGFAAIAIEGRHLLRRSGGSPVRRSWIFFSVGSALWSLASGLQAVLETFLTNSLRIPSVVNLIQLAGSLAIFAALSTYTASLDRSFGRMRILLDISLVCIGTVTLFWLFFYRSILLIGLADPVLAFWEEAQGAIELIFLLLTFRLITLSTSPPEFSAFVALSAGTAVFAFVDIIDGYQHLWGFIENAGIYSTIRLVAVAVWLYAIRVYQGKDRVLMRTKRNAPFQFRGRPIEMYLPLLLTYIVVGFLLLDWWIAKEIDRFALQAIIVMAVMLVARQGVLIGQSELRQYAELVNATADLAFICDREGEIILANPSLREVLETSTLEDPLPNLEAIIESPVPVDKLIDIASASGWMGEVVFRASDGSSIPASLSLIPIQDDRENRLIFAATAHDLTTVKLREEDLRTAMSKLAEAQKDLQSLNIELEKKVDARTQELKDMVSNLAQLNEELEELDKLKTEFVALVSHELRAPLTNIQTGLEVVLDSVDNADMGDSLELIMSETSRLGGFVETILDLSALEAGRFPIQLRPLSMGETAREVIRSYKKQSGGERIRDQITDDLPNVRADDQGVRSVISHLLDNAIKYAPGGEILMQAYTSDDRVILSISDSGPGIPEEEREKVFEMFYRMDSRDSREVYGRGLGLNLAKRFLEVMDGGIEIGASATGGTEVRFWLPTESSSSAAEDS